jgi:hypothetical protein
MAWSPARKLALGAAAAAAAALALHPVTVLELTNDARAQPRRLALAAGQGFAVISHHSIHEQPVTEEFAVDARRGIVLEAVSSPSAAVREYLGLSSAGERQPIERAVGELVFRVAAGTPQRLRVGDHELSFLELGDHGDRVVVRAVRAPALAAWVRAHLASRSR